MAEAMHDDRQRCNIRRTVAVLALVALAFYLLGYLRHAA
jgi:hypothetical protein